MRLLSFTLAAGMLISPVAQANDLMNLFQKGAETYLKTTESGSASGFNGLTQDQISAGLREALRLGTERVVSQLGVQDGFNLDKNVHIPLPPEMAQVKSLLGKFGMDGLASDIELRLNRAAEKAMPQTTEIFVNAINKMTLQDVQAIYNGPKDSATQYFKKVATADLQNMIKPVAQETLNDVGALTLYDQFTADYKKIPFVPDVKANLIDHTTNLAVQGIFHYLAMEEAAIRENPQKRTTEILKTVFGN